MRGYSSVPELAALLGMFEMSCTILQANKEQV